MNELHGIGWAVKQMKDGNKVRRRDWKWGTFIVLMPELQLPPYSTHDIEERVNYRTAQFIGEDQPLNCRAYIARYNARREWQPGWVCTQEDLLANDWEVLGG
jgi:Protein of unknown function (DUF2829)